MSKTKYLVEVHFVLDDESEAQDMQKAADLIVSVLEEGGIT